MKNRSLKDLKEEIRILNEKISKLELSGKTIDDKVALAKNESCPCTHTIPCHPRCTCIDSFSSRGCKRCCSYGSKEHQKKMAEHLARKIDSDLDKVDLRSEIEDLVLRSAECDRREAEAVARLEKKNAECFKKMTDKEKKKFLSYFDEKERKDIIEKYSK